MAGCTAVEVVPPPTPVPFLRRGTPVPTAGPSSAETTTEPTASAGVFDEAQVQSVTNALNEALASRDPARLEPLMIDRVDLIKGNELQQTLSRAEATRWLAERVAATPEIIKVEQNAHFALLDVTTGPWTRSGPVTQDQLVFKLHRYDASGRQNALAGEWKIDGIAY